MEQQVWGEPGILESLRDKVVIASLYVDEREELPKEEQGSFEVEPGRKMEIRTTGDKWKYMQVKRYKILAQPYYVLHDENGNDIQNGSADYEHHSNPADFKKWLDEGLKLHEKSK
jgi:thiol:disulfide interchange protein DsbD